LLTIDPRLHVYVGVYLLPLRHPVPVARQLATLAELAPGRLSFAVGIGGEDRAEVANCGVDPRTRGRRTDESLAVLRRLLAGETVTYAGEHIDVEAATIRPAPSPPIPVVVGGRSDAALERAARFGDGWLGLWVSPARYRRAVTGIEERAVEAGRTGVDWNHGLTAWVGIGATAEEGRRHLAPAMEDTYGLAFSTFERWSPCGSPAEIAEHLRPYVEAGCSTVNLMPRGQDLVAEVDGVAEIRRLLRAGTVGVG
jgi:alkanesulfonate monooxygenase SsuD/methylene tetrahydromethanopterin reductase-like flavin-dependent oxidoreductase (luciferase family)